VDSVNVRQLIYGDTDLGRCCFFYLLLPAVHDCWRMAIYRPGPAPRRPVGGAERAELPKGRENTCWGFLRLFQNA
jgi:hypothetical protein